MWALKWHKTFRFFIEKVLRLGDYYWPLPSTNHPEWNRHPNSNIQLRNAPLYQYRSFLTLLKRGVRLYFFHCGFVMKSASQSLKKIYQMFKRRGWEGGGSKAFRTILKQDQVNNADSAINHWSVRVGLYGPRGSRGMPTRSQGSKIRPTGSPRAKG